MTLVDVAVPLVAASATRPSPPGEWECSQVRRPTRFDQASIAEVVAAARQLVIEGTDNRKARAIYGARRILEALEGGPGITWADRWAAFETSLPERGSWLEIVQPEHQMKKTATPGVWVLCELGLFRPSFGWFLRERIRNSRCIEWIEAREPGEWKTFDETLHAMEHSTLYMGVVRQTLARLLACTGAKMSQLTAIDLIAYNMAREAEDDLSSASGIQVIWRALRETGWLEHESAAMPFVARFKNGQKSAEELVDQHGIRSPHREVFVEYFKARRPDVTYSTWVTVASKLLNTFWNRSTCLQPGLKDFTITRAAIDQWTAELRGDEGTARADYDTVLFTVRGFYLDVAKWAVEDSYWVP